MNDIIFACSLTNKETFGNYSYFLYSRIDGYSVILRSNSEDSEWLFYVLNQDQITSDIWSSDITIFKYQRPDEMSVQIRKYVITKLNAFIKATSRDVENWK